MKSFIYILIGLIIVAVVYFAYKTMSGAAADCKNSEEKDADGKCVPKCPTGEVKDANGKCVPKPPSVEDTLKCPAGQVKDASGKCVSSLPPLDTS